jgi:hypothetical protein
VQPQPVGQLVVVGRDEATLGRGHVLGRVQAERAVPEAPRPPAAEGGPVGLAGILHDHESVPVGDGPDHVHVGHQTEEVNRADRPRPRGDGGLDPLGVDQVRVGFDVDEDRGGSGVEDRVRRRGERVRDRDHLVAGLEADAREDRHQRQRAVGHRHGMADAAELGPLALELGDLAALREHAAREDLGDGRDLLGADVWACDRDHAGAPWVMAGPRCSWRAPSSPTNA